MSYPTDGLPRFKATDVNVLDRANCHRIVATWENPEPVVMWKGYRPAHPRAADLARAEADRLNALDEAGLPFDYVPPAPVRAAIGPTHGTVGGYTNHGCRCTECREAWRIYHADWRVRTRAAT